MTYYHVTEHYHGSEHLFEPELPKHIQRGEDKKTPRICVKNKNQPLNWLAPCKTFIYASNTPPIDPSIHRSMLIQQKKLKHSCNDFKLSIDGLTTNERWYLEPVRMQFVGVFERTVADYIRRETQVLSRYAANLAWV